jgi:phosphoserine aminotransferase
VPYDIVYANSQKAFVLAAVALAASRKKLVWHCHDILTPEHFNKSQISAGHQVGQCQGVTGYRPKQRREGMRS